MKDKFILLFLLLTCSFYKINAQDWNEIIKVAAGDRGPAVNAQFGYSVAISGDYAIIGAPFERKDTNGEDLGYASLGAAYFFKKEGDSWVQQQKIGSPHTAANKEFGGSVAIDGDYAIVGARTDRYHPEGEVHASGGAAYIYHLEDDVWVLQQTIVANDKLWGTNFGFSVSISGEYVVVGSNFDNRDANGGGILITQAGSAYIFKRNGDTWSQQQKIVASDRTVNPNEDRFGHSVAIDGDYIVVGATYDTQDPGAGEGNPGSGSAYIFVRNGETWSQQQKVLASDAGLFYLEGVMFGRSVAISGDYIVIGSGSSHEAGENNVNFAGSAYILKRDGTTWVHDQKLLVSDRVNGDNFGVSVAINGDNIVVGATGEKEDADGEDTLVNAGAAYVYKLDEGAWILHQKLAASDREAQDQFGVNVSVSGNYILTGANLEDHDANGEDMITSAGSAYFFGSCDILAPAIEGEAEVCYGKAVTVTVAVGEGEEANWYDTEDGSTPTFTGNEFTTPELTETTTYWVEAFDESGCVSGRVAVTVTVNPLPELTVADPEVETCEGTKATLQASVAEGSLVIWYDSADATESIDTGNTYITDALTETTSYWVQAYNTTTHCVSERIEIVVTVLPAPELNLETPEPVICSGTEAELFATSEGNVIFWYANEEDDEYLYHGNLFITEELTETTTYWVEAYNIATGCASERIEVTVTVNPIPDAPVAVEVQYFEEGATLADLDVEADGDLTWYANEELTVVLPETTPLVAFTTYYVTQTIGDCESDAIGIRVEPELGISGVNGKDLTVYPNPTESIVKIQSKVVVSTIEVFNISGQRLTSLKAVNEVNISGYPSGTYVLRITLENGEMFTRKVIRK